MWEQTLLSWGLLVIYGIIFWFIMSIKEPPTKDEPIVETEMITESDLWKSPIAWQVTLFMGLQSFVFYVVVSWLPK